MAKNILAVFFLLAAALAPLSAQGKETRRYLTTGNWYPSSEEELNRVLDSFFKDARAEDLHGRVVGIVSPHAGFEYSGKCAAWAYKYCEKIPDVRRIIILGGAHRAGFYGACVSNFEYNSTPLGSIPVDTGITAELAREKLFSVNNGIMQYEHSIENQLPFIQRMFKGRKYRIVPILLGGLRKEDFKGVARVIGKYVDEKTLVVASTDFTHYGRGFGYVPFTEDIPRRLKELDLGLADFILKLDFDGYYGYKEKTGITACGFVPVGVLINIFADRGASGKLVDYYTSGSLSGDYSTSVSYVSIIVSAPDGPPADTSKNQTSPVPEKIPAPVENPKETASGLTAAERRTLLAIARESLGWAVRNKKLLDLGAENYEITENLKKRCGVFVTLRENGRLRGCIGSIEPRRMLCLGVRDNAVSAALHDRRFLPVAEDELDGIEIEISVMTPLQEIDDYRKIRLGTDGVIIRDGPYQAVYLPQVATETGWDLDEFLGSLCRKAGLPPDTYRTSKEMRFFVFQAEVFSEKEPSK